MWGWRGRIGFIIPSSDLVQEPDAFTTVPEGVAVHFTRIPLPQPFSTQKLKELSKDLIEPLELLKTVKPNVIVFGCTSGSFIGGPGYDTKIAERITKISGAMGTTTSSSVVAALNKLGLKRISVLAPYSEEVTQRLKIFLEGNGIDVLKLKALNLDMDLEIARVAPERIYEYAREVDVDEAEGFFISCTTFRAMDAIEDLEKDSGKLVVTANQAAIWNALRLAGVQDEIDGRGTLFKRF
jgi:maleate isomerase